MAGKIRMARPPKEVVRIEGAGGTEVTVTTVGAEVIIIREIENSQEGEETRDGLGANLHHVCVMNAG